MLLILAWLRRRHPRLLRRGLVRHPHEHPGQLPHGLRLARGQAAASCSTSRCAPA
ncbi:MAG: hypothetical protein MZU91_14980 [Desulfosudis oleivorans]|nr:hypothetical protein [Desulfosudis oleivorans]